MDQKIQYNVAEDCSSGFVVCVGSCRPASGRPLPSCSRGVRRLLVCRRWRFSAAFTASAGARSDIRLLARGIVASLPPLVNLSVNSVEWTPSSSPPKVALSMRNSSSSAESLFKPSLLVAFSEALRRASSTLDVHFSPLWRRSMLPWKTSKFHVKVQPKVHAVLLKKRTRAALRAESAWTTRCCCFRGY